jgi:large subunit ribosomal protein L24
MRLEFERMSITGRLLYAQGGHDRLPRLEAALTTPEIDLDRLHVLATAVLGDAPLDFPREGALSLVIGRATLAGIEARQTDVKARIDAHGIDVEQLSIRDFGGATLGVKGRIDTKLQPPRGTIALDLDAQSLEGVLLVLEKFAPEQAAQLRRVAPRLAPLALRATLTLDPGAAGAALAAAKFKLDALGARSSRLALIGDASTSADLFKHDKLAALGTAKVNVIGRIEAEDGQALMQLMHLDRFVAAENRPARVILAAKGLLDQTLDVDVQLASGALSAAAQGKLRLSSSSSRSATLGLAIKNANFWSPRKSADGRPTDVWPTSLSAQLALEKDTLRLQEINGTVAGVKLGGALTLGLQTPMQIEGAIELDSFDLPAATGAVAGLPTRVANAGQRVSWPTEPLEPLFGALKGQIELKAARVVLTPKLDARDFRGVAHFGESQLALQVSEGVLAGGVARGELILLRASEGLIGRMAFKITGADAVELLPGDGTVSGRLTSDLSAEGSGRSAVALLGSMHGQGTFTLENGKVARLNPGAFAAVMRAVDQGLPIDANRLRDRMDLALASGPLGVALAQGSIVIEAGQARLRNSVAGAENTELATTAGLDLVQNVLDARLAFTGPEALGFANTRPQIDILVKGPLEGAKRTIDAAQFASWLALRSVEQQSRTLDMLEGREPSAGSTASGSATTAPKPDNSGGAKNNVSEGQATTPRAKPRPRSAAQKPKPAAGEDPARAPRAPPQPRSLSEFFFFGPR